MKRYVGLTGAIRIRRGAFDKAIVQVQWKVLVNSDFLYDYHDPEVTYEWRDATTDSLSNISAWQRKLGFEALTTRVRRGWFGILILQRWDACDKLLWIDHKITK